MISLDPKELYSFLESKNIKQFFHANTVKTSCTFIQQKGLLSRGSIESKGLIQTAQSSDQIDKKYNVWNDIFLDIVDLHGYFPRQNLYGPVCFVLDSKLLLDAELPNICITKDNPIYWNDSLIEEDKYYSSVDEYAECFEDIKKNHILHSQMFTIHNTLKRIPFKKYLIKIIFDNPGVKIDNIFLYRQAKETLIDSLKKSGLDVDKLEVRKCSGCFCHDNYLNQVEESELKKLFL